MADPFAKFLESPTPESGDDTAPGGLVQMDPSGQRSYRNKNVFNVEYHDWMQPYGATLAPDKRFAKFPNYEAGVQAATDLIKRKYAGLSIKDGIEKFAPTWQNKNTPQRIKETAAHFGATPDTPIGQLPLGAFMQFQAKYESPSKINPAVWGDDANLPINLAIKRAGATAATVDPFKQFLGGQRSSAGPQQGQTGQVPAQTPMVPGSFGEQPPPTQPKVAQQPPVIKADMTGRGDEVPLTPQPAAMAPFHVLAGAASVDDPQTKFKIFAKNRFPHLTPEEGAKRYWVRDGDVYYMDDNGATHKEVPEGFLNSLKSFVSEASGRWPEVIGGTLGDVYGGPSGAAGGAAVGSVVRKGINAAFLGEPFELADVAESAVKEGVAGGVGSVAGRLIGGGVGKLYEKAQKPGYLAQAAMKDIPNLNPAEMQRMVDLGRQYGLRLTIPEITGSPSLQNAWILAMKTAGPPAEKIKSFMEQIRVPEINNAIKRELANISPTGSGGFSQTAAGEAIIKGAADIEEGIKTTRSAKAQPLYQVAFDANPMVDITHTLDRINKLAQAQPEGSAAQTTLNKIGTLLTKEEPIKIPVAGGPTTKRVPVTNLEILDNAKIEIDRMLEAAKQDKSISNKMRRTLTDVKNTLVKQMDDASPDYAKARETFAKLSRPLNDFRSGNPDIMPRDKTTQTLISRLSKITNEEAYEKVPDMIFKESKEAIARTRNYFQQNYPDAWNSIVRSHLERRLSEVKDVVSDKMGARGYRFKQKVFGLPEDQEKLKAALTTQQYNRLRGFMELLDRTEKTVYGNSMTTPLKETADAMKSEAGSKIAGFLKDFDITNLGLRYIGKLWDAAKDKRFAGKVVDALLDPNQAQRLATISRLPNTPKKAIEMGGFLAGVYGEKAYTQTSDTPEPDLDFLGIKPRGK